jgi:hypothetical protein
MIDIDLVTQLQNKAMLVGLEKVKEREIAAQKSRRGSHTKVLQELEDGKLAAEKELPQLLAKLEDEISYAVEHKKYNVEFKCGDNGYRDEWKLLYTKIMLCQMLPLKGLACRLSGDDSRTVIVSW